MRKWLRERFAWRFSLIRLVLAVVFAGASMALNILGPKIHVLLPELKGIPAQTRVLTLAGWPFPAYREYHEWDSASDNHREPITLEAAQTYDWLPWTHWAYSSMESDWFYWLQECWNVDWDTHSFFPVLAIIDGILVLTVLALILFFHPRRKPEPEPETAK
jgi:hypothetical protein